MSSAKSISLIGRLVNLGVCVRLPMPLYRVRIEGVAIARNEACAAGNNSVDRTGEVRVWCTVAAGCIVNVDEMY